MVSNQPVISALHLVLSFNLIMGGSFFGLALYMLQLYVCVNNYITM